MLLIRKFEEKTGQLYIQQNLWILPFIYWQEAIVVGTASACEPGDKHMTLYHHGHPIALELIQDINGRTIWTKDWMFKG